MFTKILFLVTVALPVFHTLPAIGARGNQWQSLSGPGNMTVLAGGKAVLRCDKDRYFGPDTRCHWLKDGWMLDSGGRYHVSDECVLTIEPVLPLDQGQYQCQVAGDTPVTSAPGQLRVNTEPGQPHIDSDDVVRVDRGQRIELQCSSEGARPAAEIEWWNVDTGKRIMSTVTNNVVRNGDTFDTISTLRMEVVDHMKVYCTAHSESFPATKQSTPVEISIRGEPRMETIKMREGDSVKVFCHNRVVKDVAMFKWFINDNQIFDENRDYLEITQFTKAYDKSIVKCVVTDQRGRDETVRIVELRYNDDDVKDALRIVKTPKPFADFKKPKEKTPKKEVMMNDDIIVEEDVIDGDDATFSKNGAKTTFLCVVENDGEASGEPKYVWVNGALVKNQNEENVSADKRYKCRTIKNGYKKINKMAKDLKTYSKSIKKMSRFLSEFTN